MERIPNLPEWMFRGDKLVTTKKIRTKTLAEDWIGDESSGLPKDQSTVVSEKNTIILENSRTY